MNETDALNKWQDDKFVVSKLLGFRYFRGKPKLTVIVNGFSFYYGKLVIGCTLNPGDDGTQLLTTRENYGEFAPQTIQMPHISVDPSLSCTYELELPWYSANEWFDRGHPAVGGDRPSIWLNYAIFNQLSSANDVAPTSVDIKVYMSMSDLEVAMPIVFNSEMDGEPSELKPGGILSGPLSAVHNVTTQIQNMGGEKIPVVGSFLAPFNAAAGVATSVLQKLGLSSPPIADYEGVHNQNTSFRSVVNGRDFSQTLRNDIKGGMAIDAEAASMGLEDDMSINNLINRIGFVETLQWPLTGGLNHRIPVHPMLMAQVTPGYFAPTPLSYACLPHQYWSGDIDFEVEIVASGFHRGTLGISYVPVVAAAPINTIDFPNKYKTAIVDLNQTRRITFTCPYAGFSPNLVIPENPNETVGLWNCSGYFHIYEINQPKSSGSTAPIGINIYVKAGPSFHLYRPNTARLKDVAIARYPVIEAAPTARFRTHDVSQEIGPRTPPDKSVFRAEGPEDDAEMIGNEIATSRNSDRSLLYFGEETVSIKDLVLKSTPIRNVSVNNDGAEGYLIMNLPIRVTNIYQEAAAPAISNLSLFAYFSQCFYTMRGGLRIKLLFNNMSTGSTSRILDPTETNAIVQFTNGVTGALYTATATTGGNILLQSAGAILCRHFEGGCEVEIPYISQSRFFDPKMSYSSEENARNSYTEAPVAYLSSIGKTGNILVFESAADDVSLHGHAWLPILRFASLVPPS